MNCLYDSKAVCRYKQACHNGYLEKSIDENIGLQKCIMFQEYQKQIELKFNVEKSGLPVSILNKSFSDYKGKDENKNIEFLKEYIKLFPDSKNLFFFGSNGTQKSTVGRIIGKEILSKGFSVSYVLADTLVKKLGKADRDTDIQNEVTDILNKDLLIIDEFERSKMVYFESGWQLRYIFPFMKERIEIVNKPIILISNSMIKNIEKDFDYSLFDLVQREFKDVCIFNDVYVNEETKSDFNKLR